MLPDGNGPLNGRGRLLGMVRVPGVISLYLVWWLTTGVGAKLDRIIQLLKQIARELRVSGFRSKAVSQRLPGDPVAVYLSGGG
jgi:hypothetical protein